MDVMIWNTLGVWVTAIATAILAILTFLTLRKLKQYAEDTTKLVDIGSKQLESSYRPLIVLKEELVTGNLIMRNLGSGIAVNIKWDGIDNNGQMGTMTFPFLDHHTENSVTVHTLGQNHGFLQERIIISYKALSGKTYETAVDIARNPGTETTHLNHEFRMIS